MNLETAAQVGEALGGIAILLTMLFGLRQVLEWNQTRRNEITQRIAEHLGTTLVQEEWELLQMISVKILHKKKF